MREKRLILLPFLLVVVVSFSQSRVLIAKRTDHPPKIDGDLADSCWMMAPVANNFIQNFPDFGKPASQKTDVRIYTMTEPSILAPIYMMILL